MQKKMTALILAVVVLSVALVGVTVAYLTDTDEVNNTFTVGNVAINLDECPVKVDENMNYNEIDGDRVKENAYTALVPGSHIDKDPTVTNTGENTAYVRVIVKHNNQDAIFNNLTAEEFEEMIVGIDESCDKLDVAWITSGGTAGANADNWDTYEEFLEEDTKVYVFYYKLAKGESKTVFTDIDVPADFDNETLAAVFGDLKIDVYAQAIQVEGFANAQAAWAEFPTSEE